jgi:hypothetical protein
MPPPVFLLPERSGLEKREEIKIAAAIYSLAPRKIQA